MTRIAEIVESPIDVNSVYATIQHENAGAVLVFVGTTRKLTNQKETTRLFYECHPTMAPKKLTEIVELASERWGLLACVVIHRIGEVAIKEPSVVVAVSAPHRAAAYEANRWLIDTLKQEVPIWKQEECRDGSKEWVHPNS